MLHYTQLIVCFLLSANYFTMGDFVGESLFNEGDLENELHDSSDNITGNTILEPTISFVPVVNSSNCFEGSYSYCTEIDNYPTEYIRAKLLIESKKYTKLITPKVKIPPYDGVIGRRTYSADETYYSSSSFPSRRHNQVKPAITEPLCRSVRHIRYIKTAKNKYNDWRYIVNQDNFTQGVEIEECINPGSECLTITLPMDYRTECKQHFIARVLLTINSEGEMVTDTFPLPSCCKCVLIKT